MWHVECMSRLSAVVWQSSDLCAEHINMLSLKYHVSPVIWQCCDLQCVKWLSRFSNNLTVQWLVCELVQHFISASSNLTVHWLVCCMCEQVQHSVSASSYLCAKHVDRFSILFPPGVTWQCSDLCAVHVNRFSAVSATGECSDLRAVWTCSSVAFQQLLGSMCRAYALCMNMISMHQQSAETVIVPKVTYHLMCKLNEHSQWQWCISKVSW